MSVTIVQAPPQNTSSAASTDSAQGGSAASAASAANDSSAAMQNFAALLFGQMIPLSPSIVQNVQQQVANKDETQQGSDTETNPNALIAALSALPIETRPEITAPTGDSTAASATTNDRSRTAPSLADLKGSNAKTETAPAAVGTEASVVTPPQTAATDDKAAKFAVPVATAAVAAEVKSAEPSPADAASANLLSAAAAAAAGEAKQAQSAARHDSATLTVQTPVRDANWANDLGQKVVWLANNDKQSAQITLNPPQMGPIEVTVKIDNGSATASFVSASQETRDALETAMPRLREMFASAGIELGQTNVGAESFRQQTASDYNGSAGNATRSDDNAILGTSATTPLTSRVFGGQQGNGRVDIFA